MEKSEKGEKFVCGDVAHLTTVTKQPQPPYPGVIPSACASQRAISGFYRSYQMAAVYVL